MSILQTINSPKDLKGLSEDELNILAEEIRDFLVSSVSNTGGHLASNLGAVELTIAIHRAFNLPKDKLVFDVGHQCYVHKILTGRMEGFEHLRQMNGISGFPKPYESEHDAFVAGHASNSVSVALGMARARTLKNEDYSVIALLGDGALTGGLSYEGLSDAGDSGEPLIVILNDNGMAIGSNVGGMAKYLAHERLKPGYMNFKRTYRQIMNRTAAGRSINKVINTAKNAFKEAVLHCSMFEEMGFEYLGPVDGHDIAMMSYVLRLARDMQKPVLIHAITTKGKGYPMAEKNPDEYHGVSPFDTIIGVKGGKKRDYSAVFGETVTKLAESDDKIFAVTAAMGSSTGLDIFRERFPERFSDVGIAEEHATSMCAGMAKEGMTPVFAVYSTFLQRGYDELIHDVAIQKLHVVFGVDRAGLVGADGETHHGAFDVPYLQSVPNMTIYSPSSFSELSDMLERAVKEENGPVAVRYPRGGEGEYTLGGVDDKTIGDGTDFTIVTYGNSINTAIKASDILKENGINVQIVKLGKIFPNNFEKVFESLERTNRLLVLEECGESGSVGEKLSKAILLNKITLKSAIFKNLGGGFVTHGDIDSLYKLCGIDAKSIARAITEELSNE